MQQCPDAAGQRWYSRGLTGSPNQDAPWGNDFHGDRNLRAAIWKPSPAGLCTRVYRGFSHLQTDLPVPMWEGGIDKGAGGAAARVDVSTYRPRDRPADGVVGVAGGYRTRPRAGHARRGGEECRCSGRPAASWRVPCHHVRVSGLQHARRLAGVRSPRGTRPGLAVRFAPQGSASAAGVSGCRRSDRFMPPRRETEPAFCDVATGLPSRRRGQQDPPFRPVLLCPQQHLR